MAEPFDVRILTLPDNLDPCDFLIAQGAHAFESLVSTAPDALEHKIRCETVGLEASRETHRANRALENILHTMAAAPATQEVSALRLREQQMLARLARQFLVTEDQLRWRLAELRSERAARAPAPSAAAQPSSPTNVQALSARDIELLEILSVAPMLIEEISHSIDVQHISPGAARAIYDLYLSIWKATGRVDFQQVLSELEDADLKSLLVDIDERAQEKASRTELSPRDRLAMLVAGYANLENTLHRRRRMQDLEAADSDEQSLRVLQEMLELARQSRKL
jgi:DNA primase